MLISSNNSKWSSINFTLRGISLQFNCNLYSTLENQFQQLTFIFIFVQLVLFVIAVRSFIYFFFVKFVQFGLVLLLTLCSNERVAVNIRGVCGGEPAVAVAVADAGTRTRFYKRKKRSWSSSY